MIVHGNKLFIMILKPTELLKLFSLCNKLYYNFNYYLFHSYSINNNYGKYDIHTPQPSYVDFNFYYDNFSNFLLKQIKGALSGLRRFLATESLLKIMKNAFCFTLKAFFAPKIF